MADLSIVIPARNEEFLSRTIQDILEHAEGDTEVIAVLDGAWATPGIPQSPQVHVVYLPAAIGQRAATNLGARISTARYLMKADAHVAFDQGFDRKLMAAAEELGPDVTQIPAQKNLHVYDQVCECGWRGDQAPAVATCPTCGSPDFGKEMVWQPRRGSTTTSWVFDADLHFQYDKAGQKRQSGDICDVMTSLGACFFADREYFLALGGFDERSGSWGQFGQELACKVWLSGGRHVVNRSTWFAHFFRVGGIGFPYEIHHSDQEKARTYHRNLWRANAWPGQVRPLRWLVDKFAPLAGWTPGQVEALPQGLKHGGSPAGTGGDVRRPRVGVVYYTDNRCPFPLSMAVRARLKRLAPGPVVTVTCQPAPGDIQFDIIVPAERGYLTMFRQILAGLEALDTEYAFLAEHDVLYHPSHFEFIPPRDDCYYYNLHWWKVDAEAGRAVTYTSKQTSQLCANRLLLVEHYRARVRRVEAEGFSRAMGFEPGSHRRAARVDDVPSEVWRSTLPNIDVRHGQNLTPSRWSRDQFRDQRNCQGWQEADHVSGWPAFTDRPFHDFLIDVGDFELARHA